MVILGGLEGINSENSLSNYDGFIEYSCTYFNEDCPENRKSWKVMIENNDNQTLRNCHLN